MKHIRRNLWGTITVIFMLFEAGSAFGQQAITQASYSATVVKVIVREYSYPATVSYVETAAEHYFAYADASMTVRNAEINPDLFVTDMKVHSDYVYFCGYDVSLSKAVWGWFDINTLIAGNIAYYTHSDFVCGGQQADTLYGLCTFEEQGKLHVATVGTTHDGMGKRLPCTIDITGTEGIATGWSYTMGVSTCDYDYYSRQTRVCVTDNFVVTAGETEISFLSEGYRIHYRSSMFFPGGPQDSLYIFPTYNDWFIHDGIDMAMTHTTGDTIASAVYWYNISDPVHPAGVIVNVYDINQVLTIPAASPVYSMLANLPQYINPYTYNYYIRDIVYSNIQKELVLLLSGNFPYGLGTGSAIAELPLPPTTATAIFLNDHILTSLDNYNGQQNLLTQGFDNIYPGTSTYFTQPLSTASLCASKINVPIDQPSYAAKTHHCPYSVCTIIFDCTDNKPLNTIDIPNAPVCIE